VGVLEYRTLWGASPDSGTTSTAAAQTERLCIALGNSINMNINCLTPGITTSKQIHNRFVSTPLVLAFHGIIFIDHSNMALPNKTILLYTTLRKTFM
jgi:hypothetical protein